jgi:type IV pilus assembly PilX-like protein
VKALSSIRKRQKESGIALLISIFILLLISVVAIALIVSSGTETALAGNYRSATGVYYAGQAGLEEVRGRLYPKNPSSFQNTAPGFLPSPGVTLAVGSVAYVLNPSPTEAAGTLLATYPDTEYDTEFGAGALAGATVSPPTLSVWNTPPLNALNIPGPLYKWVRINAVTERSLNVLVAPYNSGPLDATTPIFYDGAQLNISNSGAQVLEITSLAVLPNGSQKIVQYLVAPSSISMPPFPAAITLLGNNVDYTGPDQNSWKVSGNDTVTLGSCTPGGPVYAVGYFNSGDSSHDNIDQGTFTAHAGNYTGSGGTTPNLGPLGALIPPTFRKPSQLDALAQSITQNADVVIPGNVTGSSLPSGMSPSNLMTVVVNGNLDLTGWHSQGYGLLLVTGNLTYDPDASWNGIVLLIGQGLMTGSHSGSGQFVGGVFLAKTRDLSGTLFPDPTLPNTNGTPGTFGSNIQFSTTMGGQGVYYSSCWIQAALPTGQYNVLSFHEISQ